jgi:hypothetical protein
MKKLIILLTCLFTLNAFAQDDKTVTLVVSGQGKTQEEARQNALRGAIEQAFGTFISSKTEILNDSIIKDEIVSVTNGNIQKYEVISVLQLSTEVWSTILNATVSVNKLQTFCESKGVSIEFNGGLFALNIKQQMLNEKAEEIIIYNMVGVLHELMQKSINYTIINGPPESLDTENKRWSIPITVTAISNKNIEKCAEYFIQILKSISLDSIGVAQYNQLRKKPIKLIVERQYYNEKLQFYLRRKNSIKAINSFISNWNYYLSSYIVEPQPTEELNYKYTNTGFGGEDYSMNPYYWIRFPESDAKVAEHRYEDIRSINQIEKLSGFVVMSKPETSRFLQGGYLVSDDTGKMLIVSIHDIETTLINDVDSIVKIANLGGFNNWRLPDTNDFKLIERTICKKGIGNLEISESSWDGANSWPIFYVCLVNSDKNKLGYTFSSLRGRYGYGIYPELKKGPIRVVKTYQSR